MKKFSWAIILALIAVVVLVISPTVLSAQSRPKHEQKSMILDNHPLVGTFTKEPVDDEAIRSAVTGIQKTINIPAAAFVPQTTGYYYWISYFYNYIYGESNSYYTYMLAPIVFPKGAKKIVYIDFYVWDDFGGGLWLSAWDSYPWSASMWTLVSGYSSYYAGWVRYRWTPYKGYTIYPTDVFYIAVGILYDGYFKAAVVTYK